MPSPHVKRRKSGAALVVEAPYRTSGDAFLGKRVRRVVKQGSRAGAPLDSEDGFLLKNNH